MIQGNLIYMRSDYVYDMWYLKVYGRFFNKSFVNNAIAPLD